MISEEWTDARLDDLNKKVDDGFREMREEFLMQLTWGLIGTMLVGFLGTIVAIATQM